MREYEKLNHMEVSKGKRDEGNYMPHHGIIRESSITTKLRVVFDASAKTSTGVSLNETLMAGPQIQDNIATLLMRFRSHPIALTADVEKMYRQFWIHEDDQKHQKILWRFREDEPIRIYQLKTVTYGTSAAPFLAVRCLKQLAMDEGALYPEAARILIEDFYVDDLMTGADSLKEAKKLQADLCGLTSKGGMHLTK
ncbi:uncharacterized protein LOC127289470 [Leptopilina boulardi]|uniref:uncharacterized protein LOC127289470 n=1 Tax=Leptopilina boulardi TaxID=63433 RepID=UPI0021F58C07|nr:uncharacterized protein LOC127289470 [Leptopilina boulardi]